MHAGQEVPELLGLLLDLVVHLGELLLHHFGHAGVEVGRGNLQIRLRLGAIAVHRGASVARNLQHGRVFRQRVDEDHVHTSVAGVHDSALEQAVAETTATGLLEHRDAELGAVLVLRVLGERQVGHGNQLQAAVVDAEDFVAAEVELLCIAADLLVIGGIAKAQVAVSGLQLEQMGGDALAVRRAQRANRDHQGRGRHSCLLQRMTVTGAQHASAGVPGCLEQGFGSDHGLNFKGFP